MAIISISRGSLSLGKALAERLSAALGIPCVGRELIHLEPARAARHDEP